MAKKTNKNFLEGIRASFTNLGMSEETADTIEKAADDMINPPAVEPVVTEEVDKVEIPEVENKNTADTNISDGTIKEEAPEKTTESQTEEKPQQNETPEKAEPDQSDRNLFDDAVAEYEGFGVIKNRKTGKITAVGFMKAEDEKYITALLKDKAVLKDRVVDYAYLPKESLNIFRSEYESGKLTIESLDKGLITVVGLDELVKTDNDHYDKFEDIDAKLEREGFLRDIDQLGEPRKTSTYLPDEYIRYCAERASEFSVYKGPVRWVLTNLLFRDINSRKKSPNSL